MAELVSAERVKFLLVYNETTGIFTWKYASSNRVRVGDVAGVNTHGYILIGIDGRKYQAHRLAWLYMTSEWPVNQIDHMNGNRGCNRWNNLRDATHSENQQNQANPSQANKCGYRGVSFDSQRRLWRAQIKSAKRNISIGYFDSPQDAHLAYLEKKKELHKGFIF